MISAFIRAFSRAFNRRIKQLKPNINDYMYNIQKMDYIKETISTLITKLGFNRLLNTF